MHELDWRLEAGAKNDWPKPQEHSVAAERTNLGACSHATLAERSLSHDEAHVIACHPQLSCA